MIYLAILVGGMIGGALRYAVGSLMPSSTFPYDTLLVNLLGSLALGLFYGMADVRDTPGWLRMGVGTGVIGSFTTFSTFSMGTATLASVRLWLAVLYMLGNLVGGPVLAYVGDRTVIVIVHKLFSNVKEVSA